MRKLYNRFYSDYLLPNRLGEYCEINQVALENGYHFQTTLEFYNNAVLADKPQTKVFLHRHDIDSDTKTAKRFFDVEQKLGIKTSYYFRLNTLDIELMKDIAAAGHEVGYHFEEIAQYCKDFKIKSWEKVTQKMPEIQARFTENFLNVESKLGFKIRSVASHGDFVNRFLGHSNYELLTDKMMSDLGIELECYNEQMMQKFDSILSDRDYPSFYRDQTPREAITEKVNVIYLLTHTRHWHVARWENTTDNMKRMWEGFRYKI